MNNHLFKRFLSVVLTLLMVLSCVPTNVFAADLGSGNIIIDNSTAPKDDELVTNAVAGTGTSDDPYVLEKGSEQYTVTGGYLNVKQYFRFVAPAQGQYTITFAPEDAEHLVCLEVNNGSTQRPVQKITIECAKNEIVNLRVRLYTSAAEFNYIEGNVTITVDDGSGSGESCDHSNVKYAGDCTQAVTCEKCGQIALQAKGEHTPEADDGNCTTAVYCSNDGCTKVAIAGEASHDFVNRDCTRCDATYDGPSMGLEYELSSDGTYYIVAGIGECTDKDLIIPDTYEGLPVKEIGYRAFYNGHLYSVFIPASVTKIGEDAFTQNGALGAVTFAENSQLKIIDAGAFYGCHSLEGIIIPASVTSIGAAAFNGCNGFRGDDSVTFAENSQLTHVGDWAFSSCVYLRSIEIPASVVSIGQGCFQYCRSLQGIWVDSDNPYYCSDDRGVLFNKEKTVLVQAPGHINGSYEIPASVTAIDDYAFVACSELESLTFAENSQLSRIGYRAFYNCSKLNSFAFPTNNQSISIGEQAFMYCKRLTTVEFSASVTNIGAYAFADAQLLPTMTMVVTFAGDAPAFGKYVFRDVIATAYYPVNNATWTADVMQNYEGTITWVPYGVDTTLDSEAELLEALANGGKVVLDADITITAPIVITNIVELDLNGYTLTYNGNVMGEAMITNKGTLTINDSSDPDTGVINYNYTGANDASYGKGNYTISNAGTLTVNGGKITIANLRQHAKYPIDNNSTTGDAVLVINGGHLYNYNTSAIRQFCNSTVYENSVTINGGLIEGYSAIWVQNPGKQTVNGTLTINGGEIKTTAAAYVNGTSELKDVSSRIYFTIDGEGGAWSEGSALTITGGTFNENVYLAENAPANIAIGENAKFNGYVELPAPTVVEVDTLDELLAALEADNNLPIVITAQIVIPEGETVVLDLNGKTVNSVFNGSSTTNHIYALSNKGTLTITDSVGGGSINSRGIYNYGSLTLNGGAINAIDGNGGYAVNNESGSTFVMNGGTVAATNEDDYQSSSGGYDATPLEIPAGCTATLNGGKITNVCDFTFAIQTSGTLNIPATSTIEVIGTHGAIAVQGGTTTVDAGTFKIPEDEYSRTDNVLYVSGGSLVVNGGTFIGDSDTASGGSCVCDTVGGATINGGSFSGSSGGDVWGTTGTTIKGGTFANLTQTQYIAPDYELGEDGKVVEAAKNYVAQIGEQKFETLAAALAAAQDDDTIILLADMDVAANAFIELNGKKNITLTAAEGVVVNGDISVGYHASHTDSGVDRNDSTLTVDGLVVKGTLTVCSNDAYLVVENCQAAQITVKTYTKTGMNITIDGNTADGAMGTAANGYGLFLVPNATDYNLTVSDNTFKNIVSHAFVVQGCGDGEAITAANSIAVTRNTFKSWGLGGKSDRAAFKIWADMKFAPSGSDLNGTTNAMRELVAEIAANGNNTFASTASNTVEFDAYGAAGDAEDFPAPAYNVAEVNGVKYTDLQEAIKAAAPSGTVKLLCDVTVDEWIMISESLTTSDGSIITLAINGMTINGNGYTLTIKEIVSPEREDYLFYDAANLTIDNLTINYVGGDAYDGGIALKSGTISNVTFKGGKYCVLPGNGGVTIEGCTFEGTTGYAIYFEDARPGIVVNKNTFNTASGAYAITMRSNEQFTNNTIVTGRVNLANSAKSTVSGNDFGTERFKVYNEATATITGNTINNLVFNDDSVAKSTFNNNTLSAEAEAALKAVTAVNVASINGVGYTTLEEAFAAAQAGETIVLLADATPALTSQRAITKAAEIDLGGFTLTLTEDDLYFGTTTFTNGTIVVDPSVKASTAVFWMFANQTLTFDGVEIVATGVTGTYLIGINGGANSAVKLINAKITIANDTQAGLSAVICDNGNGNSIVIEGCDINVAKIEGRFYLGGASGSVTVVNSNIDLNGVKEGFYLRANQTLAIEGNSTVDITLNDTNGRYGINVTDLTASYTVADTATVNATVNKPGPVKVTTYEELLAALAKDNANVIMMNDITATATQSNGYGKTGIMLDAGDVLDGNGKTLTINGANGTWDSVIAMKGGEVKNLTIAGAMRGVFMPGANGDVVIDNCEFKDVIYTFNSDAGSKDYTVTIKNTTLNGWTSFSAVHKAVVFETCTFGEGNGYAFCRPYQATTFTDCEFNEGYEFDTSKVAEDSFAFNNCTYNNAPLSGDNNAMFYNGGSVLINDVPTNVDQPVAQIGETKYKTLAEAVAAAQDGDTILLKNGEYELPAFSGKELTFKGESKEGVIINDAPDARAQGWNGSTFHFENLTAKGATANYHGLANGVVAVTYKNCNINGLRFLYAKDVSFENCAFNAQGVEHSFWTYGASNITVTDCTFTYTDRAVNCYSENGANHEVDIAFTGCTFTYAGTADAPEGAVEINSGSVKSIELTMNGCTAPAKGAMWFNSQWDSKKGQNTVVTVDGKYVWKPLKGTGTAEDPILINDLADLILFRDTVDNVQSDRSNQFVGKYVKLTADIDLAGINWNPIGEKKDHGSFMGIFDGGNHTISNLYVEQAGECLGLFAYVGSFVEGEQAVIKNLTLHNVTVKSTNNSHYVGGVVGNATTADFENVHVTGTVEISGRGYIGGIVGHGYSDFNNVSVKATNGTISSTFWCAGGVIGYLGEGSTIKNAVVEGLTIKSAAGGLGSIVGMASSNEGTQPCTGENLSAKNVAIQTYTGAYGDGYAEYALGYLIGGDASVMTGSNTVENVTFACSNGTTNPAVSDAVASVNGAIYFDLQSALNAAAAGTGNVNVEILRDVDLTNVDWNPVTVSGPGYPLVTVNGNNKTITGLNDMLFAGTWAGKSGLIINDLTIKNSVIVNDENDSLGNVGVGAFIGYPQASATITLNNCHLVNSTVKGGHWTGGLIGMAGGYNGSDGPVFMNLTITGCSVTGSTITGKGSAGGVIGHGSCAAWTNVVIENTTVSGNTITSTGSSTNKAGAVMGTIGAAGQSTTVNGVTKTGGASVAATVSGNTVTSNGTTITTIYGRQGTSTGTLAITGGSYDAYPIEENVSYAYPAEGYKIVENNGIYSVVENTYKVSTKAELDAALAAAQDGDTILLTADIDYGTTQLAITKAITLDLGGKTLTTRNAYGGMSVKGNPTIKNGTIVHESNTAAIKVWNATAFEDLVIDVKGKGDANKTIGGIVLQSGSTTRVGSIKNVTIKGAALTNGIETYNCGDADRDVIGSMENVTINAVGTAMNISAPVGTATGCTFKGGVNGVELWIKGNYSASLTLVDCDVDGGVFAHDEFSSNPDVVNNGTLSLTVDANTTGASAKDVTLTIARAEKVEGVLKDVIENAQAKVNNTYYATLADAIKAAQAGDTVTIFEGTYAVPTMKAGITVVGEGKVLLEGTLSGTLENLTLKNLHIKGGNAQRWAYAKGNLVFENVTFEATSVYALHFDGIAAGTNLTYTDCTIIGWAAMGGSPASCVFDGCTIKGNGTYGVIRTYFDATIKDCTFDVANVNTSDAYEDGIHAVEGAEVTVTNCTNANGDMKDIVNVHANSVVVVDGVEIRNVAKIGGNYYLTLAEALAAAQDGNEVEILVAGTYKVPTGKNITIIGAVDGVVFDNIGAHNMGGASVTFNNVTFDYYPNVNYTGLQHSGNLTYNNCTFNGQVFLYGQSETFNNCTFNQESSDAYNVWTYSAEKVVFNECTFNSAGKSVLIYHENASVFNEVVVTDCDFIASAPVDGKAAIEMDSSLTAGIKLTIDAATTADGFGTGNVSGNSLWNNKKGSNTDANNDITVVVNGETVLAPVTFVAYIGSTGYTSINEAIKAANAGETVKIMEGTYAVPSMKAGITIEGVGNVLLTGTLSGTLETLTLKNLHIKGGNAQRWAYAKGDLVFENVTFEATSVYALHFDGIAEGTKLLYKNCTIIGWAAMGGSPASCVFEGCTIKGNGTYGVIRTYFDATIEDCTFDVANVNTSDAYEDGIHAVDGATVTVNNCTNVNGNMKDLVNVHGSSVVVVDGEKIQNVAKIGDNYYLTLAEAVAAAKARETVTVLTDVTLSETLVIEAGKEIVLDLNGKTINAGWDNETAGKHIYVITNRGTLTITGNGTINTRGIHNYGELTLENGTINAIDANGGYGIRNYSGATFTMNGGTIATTYEDGDAPGAGYDATTIRVDEGATFTMNGGELKNISNYTMALENYGTTTIEAGKLSSVHTTVANDGTLTVNGGEFTCNGLEGVTAHVIWAAAGTTTINGGTFDGKDNYNGFNVNAAAGATVEIKGGKFLSVHSGSLYGEGTIAVSGGNFFDEIDENRCAEGYVPVKNADGTYGVKEDTRFEFYGSNILAGDSLTMFFYINKADLNGTDYYAVVTKTFADGREAVVQTIPYEEWESYNSTLIRFGFSDISAKEMADNISVVVYNSDGTAASMEKVDSVRNYAIRMLEKTNDQKLMTALVDMLNYGAATQKYFNYNTGDLANAGIEAYRQYATQSVAYENKQVKGDNFVGASIVAENELVLIFYFKNITRDMTAYVTYTDHYGHKENLEIAGENFVSRSGYLGVSVSGLAVADGRQLVECVIKDAEGNVVASGTDSVESYVARMAVTTSDDVYDLLMKFVESSYNYFHN